MSVVVDLGTVVDVLVGRELDGRFTILEKLGGGGMGLVYRAHQHSVDREVAIKVIHANRARDPLAIQAFLREVKLTTRISNPHAVAVLDSGQTPDGLLYLVMELVEGRTLHRVLTEDGPFTPARVVRVGTQICEALAAAHALQIVHRDLKPGNIMLLARDFVKVLDFGLATSLAGDVVDESQTVLGTPAFVAPERARDGSGDSRADLYSLGCVLHALATGAPPFEAPTARDMVAMHATQPPRRAITMPDPVADVIERLLQKDPADRFQNADETRIALEDAVDPSDLRSSRTNRLAPPRSFDPEGTAATKLPPRRRKRFIVAGLILAAGAGATVFVVTRPGDTKPLEQTTPTTPLEPSQPEASPQPIAKPEPVVVTPTIEPTTDEPSVEPAAKPAPKPKRQPVPKPRLPF